MKNSKKAWDIFKKILFIFFIIFIINYFMVNSNYYNQKNSEKAQLTEEKIREFEEDVKNNEYVDIKDYLEEDITIHPNIVSKIGYETSELINDFITNKLFIIFKYLGKLFMS